MSQTVLAIASAVTDSAETPEKIVTVALTTAALARCVPMAPANLLRIVVSVRRIAASVVLTAHANRYS